MKTAKKVNPKRKVKRPLTAEEKENERDYALAMRVLRSKEKFTPWEQVKRELGW